MEEKMNEQLDELKPEIAENGSTDTETAENTDLITTDGSTDIEAVKKKFEKQEKAVSSKYKFLFNGATKDYLMKRLEESESLRADFMQEHKLFTKCGDYVFEKAKAKAGNASGVAVEDSQVFEWIEDYFRKDDKAEEEEKAKKEAERKEKLKKDEEERKKKAAEEKEKKKETKQEEKKDSPKPKAEPKPKKKAEADGQMSLFDFV